MSLDLGKIHMYGMVW